MKKQQIFIVTAIVGAVLLGVFYYAFFRESESASGDISDAVTAIEVSGDENTEGAPVFVIDSAETVASFTIAEVLRGEDYAVVGTTSEVGGQILFDPSNPSDAQIGEIVINARTFVTDSDRRNSAINNRILFTDEFEFIRFQPTAINGLPQSVSTGDSVEIEIIGDLTIMETTKSTSFTATITYDSVDQLSGTASTTIVYGEYDVAVPLTPSVTFVSDELTLDLNFVAKTQ